MKGLSGPLVLSIFTTCFGSSFLLGYNLGVVNLPADNIKKFLSEYYNSNETSFPNPDFLYGQTSSVLVACAAIAAFTCGWVADGLGRKRSLMINNVIGIVGSVISSVCLVANQPALLYVGRAISGVNSGLSIGIAAMFLTEIAPRHLRGMIGACNQLAITIGIVVSYLLTLTHLLNRPNLWPIAMGIGAIPAAIAFIISPFSIESPRWLYLKKKDEEGARSAFVRISGSENVDMFIAEMREEMEVARNQPKFRFIELFRRRDLRMPVIIAVLIQVLQQLSGINAVIANSSEMLKGAKVMPEMLQYFVVGLGLLNVICTIVALPLLEKAGRRTLLLWPTLVVAVTLLLLVVFVNIANQEVDATKTPFTLISAVLVFVYMAAFAMGLGPMPSLIVAEIFRQGPRAAAYSLSQSIQWACNLIVVASFPSLNSLLKGYVYLPYLVVVASCWVVFFLFMPETKNRTFDEVARDLAFGTIVVGKRTAALQSPVFTKEEDEEAGVALQPAAAAKSSLAADATEEEDCVKL
uniref:MFS domain-containing protein n=1 Tax=Mesocestoides corti TaxID=53468 RepID=A0A5K3FC81_MESCO